MDDNFEQWFLANGGYIDPNVEIATDKVTGRHMRVSDGQNLAPGSLIVSCPHELTISWLNVIRGSETFLSQFDLGEAYYAINQVVIVRFFVVNEYLKREESFWWPYIRSLPQPDKAQMLGTPLYYDEEDFAWIRGTNLEHASGKTERMWHIEYDEALQSLVPMAGSHAAEWSWSLYKWTATIMSSRCFPASALANSVLKEQQCGSTKPYPEEPSDALEPGSPVLIPGIDLLNHRPTAKVTWQWTSTNCRLVTNAHLEPGTQIWNNYGQKSNEERKNKPMGPVPCDLLTMSVILGYGFSLADNPADHCGLTALADATQLHQTLHLRSAQPIGEQTGSRNLDKGRNLKLRQVHWVRLQNSTVDNISNDAKRSFVFSPGFLGAIATALSNQREKAAGCLNLQGQVGFSGTDLSRNELKVMATITMLLQRQLFRISEHSANLPKWPENERQFHAARYRRGQVHILRIVNASLLARLSGLVSSDSGTTRDSGVVRLEHMLVESPSPLLTDFRAALNADLGTRKAAKIRERGWVECAFTLWVFGVWLWGQSLNSDFKSSSGDKMQSRLRQWLHFLHDTYPDFRGVEPGLPVEANIQSTSTASSTGEDALLIDSFLSVIQAAVHKNAHSLYNNPACTRSRLLWCLHVVNEESVMCPSFEGKLGDENDELVLFLEDGETL